MNKQTIFAFSIFAYGFFISSVASAADEGLSSDKQKFSYAIGLQIGHSLAGQDLEIDSDALILAIKDSLDGKKPRVSIEELQRVMNAEQKKAQQKQKANAENNLEVGKDFLTENAKRDGIKTTDSGLQYRIITEGSGDKPTLNDTVTVHYRGTLIDGTEFDSSYKRQQPATFPLKGVIKGWQEALPMMKKGAKWEIFVPANLAYGSKGAGDKIDPNETLIFEIELLDIKK